MIVRYTSYDERMGQMEISRVPFLLRESLPRGVRKAPPDADEPERFALIDKPTRLPKAGLLAVIPLRGIATLGAVRDGQQRDRVSICTGRGLLVASQWVSEVSPDTRTGADVLLVRPSPADEAFILQDQPLLTTGFSTLELFRLVPELLGSRAELSGDAVIELLARAYDFHRGALSRLSGTYEHRVNVYRRLLQVRTTLEVTVGVTGEPIGAGTHMSRSHFFQLFRAAFGIAPKKHVIFARMVRAMNLLSWSTAPVKDVAILSGYQDRTAFARAFSTMTTFTPNEFRKLARNGESPRRGLFFELMYEVFRCKMTDQDATDIQSFCNP